MNTMRRRVCTLPKKRFFKGVFGYLAPFWRSHGGGLYGEGSFRTILGPQKGVVWLLAMPFSYPKSEHSPHCLLGCTEPFLPCWFNAPSVWLHTLAYYGAIEVVRLPSNFH
jgi:hypothetical protein